MKLKLNIILVGCFGLAITTLLLISSCTEKVQSIPEILMVTVSPDTVEAGGIALIQTLAQDVDGDELVYSYTTNGGKISGYGDSVYWLAPLNGGYYKTIVRITDPSGNQSTDSIKLYVISSGKTTVSGTASFPEGINFDLSDSKMRLYTSLQERIAGHPSDSVNVFGFGSIVSFTFPAVSPGTYYLDLWKDMDNSMTMSSGDFTGWYGNGDISDPHLKPLVVQEGLPTQVQMEVNVMP
jgi:hypothetical protein